MGGGSQILMILILLPLVGALAVALLPRKEHKLIRGTAFVFGLVVFALSCVLIANWNYRAAMQFEFQALWVKSLGIHLHLGVDGFSVLLVMLTTLLTPLVILSTFKAVTERVKEYMICFLVLETAMLGALCALDMFVFYIFWELMLIPMYLIIGIWGGARKVYAAIKFFLYTMAGSVLMLIAMLYVYFKTGANSFDYNALTSTVLAAEDQWLPFVAFALAFAIKVPMFPLHTWLPDAHVEAPTGGSVILAAVLLKMGTYGFLRWGAPLFPAAMAEAAPVIAILAVVGVVFGALAAYAQKDLKRLIAYSSVSHLGFVMLGIAAMNFKALEGAIFQMINHGLSTGALFLLVGVIYERRHTRMLSDFGGLARVMPIFAVVFIIATLSSIGLPGLNGFVGEFLILVGSFGAKMSFAKVLTAIAATGVILGAVYMLWAVQKVLWGPLSNPKNQGLKDLSYREMAVFAPILLLCFALGWFPNYAMNHMHTTVRRFVVNFEKRRAASYKVKKPKARGLRKKRTQLERPNGKSKLAMAALKPGLKRPISVLNARRLAMLKGGQR